MPRPMVCPSQTSENLKPLFFVLVSALLSPRVSRCLPVRCFRFWKRRETAATLFLVSMNISLGNHPVEQDFHFHSGDPSDLDIHHPAPVFLMIKSPRWDLNFSFISDADRVPADDEIFFGKITKRSEVKGGSV